MAAKVGPRKVREYSEEFKVKAVLLSLESGVLTKDVAESLGIHPFMLSRWKKKEFREGKYVGTRIKQLLDEESAAELRRLKEVEKAVKVRKPRAGTVFHSNRGIEYAAYEYRDRLKSLGMEQSMNRPRHSEDNAAMESFWHSMKAEVYHGREFASDDELQRVIYPYLDDFYNHRRLHSSLGYKAPVQFEAAAA